MPAEYSPRDLNGIFIDFLSSATATISVRGLEKRRRSVVTRKKPLSRFHRGRVSRNTFFPINCTLIFILVIQINFPCVRVLVSLNRSYKGTKLPSHPVRRNRLTLPLSVQHYADYVSLNANFARPVGQLETKV